MSDISIMNDTDKKVILFTKQQMDATLQAVCIRCDDLKRIIKEHTDRAKNPDSINMDQITALTNQYNTLQKVMTNLITIGAEIGRI